MNDSNPDFAEIAARSPLLMNAHDTAVVVIDVQQRLLPHISGHEVVCWNIGRVVDAAAALKLPLVITEQYPRGLGDTDAGLIERIERHGGCPKFEKLMFSCRGCRELFDQFDRQSIRNILLVGIEAHVCVLQSALDLMADGFEVYIVEDAVGSRFDVDKQTAIRRMESSGATIVTTEMALFEWCASAENDGFKQVSRIVRQPFPES